MRTTSQTYESGIPFFDPKDVRTLPGGYRLDTTGLVQDTVIPGGTVFVVNDDNRTAKPIKSARVFALAVAGATSYQIEKGSPIAVGDTVTDKTGEDSATVTGIDKSASDHDTVTVSATLGALPVGQVLTQTLAAGANSATALPSGVSYNDVVVDKGSGVSVIYKGLLYRRRLPAISAEMVAALKANTDISFTDSK